MLLSSCHLFFRASVRSFALTCGFVKREIGVYLYWFSYHYEKKELFHRQRLYVECLKYTCIEDKASWLRWRVVHRTEMYSWNIMYNSIHLYFVALWSHGVTSTCMIQRTLFVFNKIPRANLTPFFAFLFLNTPCRKGGQVRAKVFCVIKKLFDTVYLFWKYLRKY